MSRIYMQFPGGKALAVTLSYDDGVRQDAQLIEIMQKNGLKGTFNLNSGRFGVDNRLLQQEAVALYVGSGMEVAVHSVSHPYLAMLPSDLCAKEILMDRIALEDTFDMFVRGMAYPEGSYNDDVVAAAKQCGIVYARTAKSTGRFDLPQDWMQLAPTCHHNDSRLMELARRFVETNQNRTPKLFYLWGHSYEFDDDQNWDTITNFAEFIGNREDVWYATNIEIYDYATAYRRLIFRMSEKKVHNPTNQTVYFLVGDDLHCVKPGATSEIRSVCL